MSKLSHIKNYNPWINANYNMTGLKNLKDSIKILQHLQNNEERFNEKELIDKSMTKENKFIKVKSSNYQSIEDIIKKCQELQAMNVSENAKGGKAPFRFLTMSVNLDPKDPNNRQAINDWIKRTYETFKDKFNIVGIQLHMNETAPHITLICQNFKDGPSPDKPIEWGNFVNQEKVVLSGEKGRKLFKDKWRQYETTMKDFSKDWGLEYKQAPTGEKSEDRVVSAFRRSLEKIKNNSDFTKKDWYAIQTFLKSEDPKLEKLRKKLDITPEQIQNFEQHSQRVISVLVDSRKKTEDRIKQQNLDTLIHTCQRNGWPVEEWLEDYQNTLTSKSKQTWLIDRMSEEIDKVIDKNEELTKLNKQKEIVKTEYVELPAKTQTKTIYKDSPETLNQLQDKEMKLNLYRTRVQELKKLFNLDKTQNNIQVLDTIIQALQPTKEKDLDKSENKSKGRTI